MFSEKLPLRLLLFVAISFGALSCQKAVPSNSKHPIPIILDTDPALGVVINGKPRDVDDGLAIIEAINSSALNLVGVTIVAGNAPMKTGYKVAKKLLELKKSDIPLIAGAEKPINDPNAVPRTKAAEFMAAQLVRQQLTIVAIGPLTNVASLITHFPREATNIDRVVVVMGRSIDQHFYIAGKGPVRDFNHISDPVAAEIVINANISMSFAPFELTSQALITSELLESIKRHKSLSADYLYTHVQAWKYFWHSNFPTEDGFHPWDSAALGYLTHREMLKCEKRGIRIRMMEDKAHGVSNNKTGKVSTKQPWIELDRSFPGPKHDYCFAFRTNQKQRFLRNIVANIY